MVFKAKAKGNRGEREIAALLTELTGVKWHRTPCSGALATSKTNEVYEGDVYTNDEKYCNIAIEVKNYKGAVTINDMFNEKSNLNKWIAQLKREITTGFEGYLFFKSKRKWIWYHKRAGILVLNYTILSALKDISVNYHDFGMITQKIDKKEDDRE